MSERENGKRKTFRKRFKKKIQRKQGREKARRERQLGQDRTQQVSMAHRLLSLDLHELSDAFNVHFQHSTYYTAAQVNMFMSLLTKSFSEQIATWALLERLEAERQFNAWSTNWPFTYLFNVWCDRYATLYSKQDQQNLRSKFDALRATASWRKATVHKRLAQYEAWLDNLTPDSSTDTQ